MRGLWLRAKGSQEALCPEPKTLNPKSYTPLPLSDSAAHSRYNHESGIPKRVGAKEGGVRGFRVLGLGFGVWGLGFAVRV